MRQHGIGKAGGLVAGGLLLLLSLLSACSTEPPPRPAIPPPPPPRIESVWPRREVLRLAVRAYRCAQRDGRIQRPRLTVVDYSLPSTRPRLWVIDLERRQVLHNELVAHGEGSGQTMAVAFSNETGSHQSSLGLFRTANPYVGRFGYSLHLEGLEPGINDRARERAIVVHGFDRVSRAIAAQSGTIGTSWGCLALPQDSAPQIIDSIAGGSAIFAYYPDPRWLAESPYLHCDLQLAGNDPIRRQ